MKASSIFLIVSLCCLNFSCTKDEDNENSNGRIPESFMDDFSTDSRDSYVLIYNSNENGILSYYDNEMIFDVDGWNGIYVKHESKTMFPEYTKVVMTQSDFGEGTEFDYGQFIIGISELGNQVPNSWTQVNRMNEIWLNVFGNKTQVIQREDIESNKDSYGDVVLNETIITSCISGQWCSVEIVRKDYDIEIYLNEILIKELSIPEWWLDLDFNVVIGGDTYNGYDAKITHLEYH